MKFSPSSFAFYSEDKLSLYKDLPEDLVDISEEDYLKFLNGELGDNVAIDENGSLCTRVIEQVIDYPSKARKLRDTLRTDIDKFLLPASTYGDILITEEQKQTLIQDSLTLAQWPALVGWPYVPFPTLSLLCETLCTIPVWSYPEQSIL